MRYFNDVKPARRGAPVAAAVAAILSAHAAHAQTAAPQPAAQASEPAATGGVLQEITVTATRREESLSKVPVSVVALTQESLDNRGIKDFSEVARFTPGVNFDTSGTNNISIRGISGTGGAGTTGIYLDDTPIQMRALAFSPDEALPKSFDIARVEVLRGPQGTLFGSGSEGGTVRYITVQPSVSKSSVYARTELSTTEGGAPSYEAGVAAGGPLVDGTLGARLAVWYRRDGGWIDHMDPVSHDITGHNTNYADTVLVRLSALWRANDKWSLTPSIYYQDQKRNAVNNFWPLYSNPGSNRFVSADPTERHVPDKFYLAALKVEGDLGFAQLISNTSYYHRKEQSGYEGTLYNLEYMQSQNSAPVLPLSWPWNPGVQFPLVDGNGIHLPAGAMNYRSPSTVDNGQMNITQEIRLQSSDPAAKLLWTAGLFYNNNRQSYLEQIHDPKLNELTMAVLGSPYLSVFGVPYVVPGSLDANGNPVTYTPPDPFDSYYLHTQSRDEQYAIFGEGSYAFTDQWKLTVGARYSRSKYSFHTDTGGPELFALPTPSPPGGNSENSFTPKVSVQYQMDPHNMFYATYAKGFRPGGANNPLPYAACAGDLMAFGIPNAPTKFDSDSVQSYEVGAKNNIANRVRIASSVYYIKWHNIQQVVVPPVCQISFIDNLGEAVAKGIDLEAEVQLTDSLSAQIAAGYTSARYTQDSRLNPMSAAPPVVGNGDAIVGQTSEAGGGQPTAPVTATAGLEYRFSAFNHESFVRGDIEYQGRGKWPVAGQDINTLQYDPANRMLPGTVFSSLRAGMQFGAVSVAAFVDNLTNTHALTGFNWSICSTPQASCAPNAPGASRLERDYTFRPRTYGVTVIYKQ